MSNVWVEVKVIHQRQSLAIIDFLLDVARRPRHFKTDDMVDFNKEVLCMKTSPRVLRDLRFKGLINYEVINMRAGIYQLYSSYNELLISKSRVEQGGYWIEETTSVVISNSFAFSVEQMNLL
jgi:hypothetical protein